MSLSSFLSDSFFDFKHQTAATVNINSVCPLMDGTHTDPPGPALCCDIIARRVRGSLRSLKHVSGLLIETSQSLTAFRWRERQELRSCDIRQEV